jgi:hypothetical protein
MNVRKLWRMLDNGTPIKMSAVRHIRRLIGESLVVFFTKLKELRDAEENRDED